MTLTAKQEAFAQGIADGLDQASAYRAAYDAENMSDPAIYVEASRIMDNPKVALRVKELRQAIEEAHKLSVSDLIRELEEARAVAMTAETPQSSAAVAATMGKAKLLGYDKQALTVSGPDGGPVRQSIEVAFVGNKG